MTDFPIVFIDEASMSTEPASLIPLMKGVRIFLSLSVQNFHLFDSHSMFPSSATTSNYHQSSLLRKLKLKASESRFSSVSQKRTSCPLSCSTFSTACIPRFHTSPRRNSTISHSKTGQWTSLAMFQRVFYLRRLAYLKLVAQSRIALRWSFLIIVGRSP